MKLIYLLVLLWAICLSCQQVAGLKIDMNPTQKIGKPGKIKLVQEKSALFSSNTSGENFSEFSLSCIDNQLITVNRIEKANTNDCQSLTDMNSSSGNKTINISHRPVQFQQQDSSSIKMSIACYPKDFLIRGFDKSARFQLSIVSSADKNIKDAVQFQLEN